MFCEYHDNKTLAIEYGLWFILQKVGVTMSYSTKEITEKLNLSMHTLRYYEKEELLPPITRDKNGVREYSDLNLEQLILIRCMRTTGMSISYIRDYMNLCMEVF